jgi:hypothetical protein
MNPEPPDPGAPTHHLTLTIQLANGSTAILAFPLTEEEIKAGRFHFRPDGPHRIALITPRYTDDSPPIVSSTLHGLDFSTASRLLGELALSLTMIQPSPQALETGQKGPELHPPKGD